MKRRPNGGMRDSLDSIGIKFATDKASQFSRTYAKPHDYLRHLERFVEPMRYNPIKILEIGVGGGESVQTWLEYFEQAHVYGVDIVSGTNEWNTPAAKTHPRYTFACGDQSDIRFWSKFIEIFDGGWDLVIDDGSHNSEHILLTLYWMWKCLKSNSFYVIEDLNVATKARNFLQGFAEDLNFEDSDDHIMNQIDSIYFAKELAILRKK